MEVFALAGFGMIGLDALKQLLLDNIFDTWFDQLFEKAEELNSRPVTIENPATILGKDESEVRAETRDENPTAKEEPGHDTFRLRQKGPIWTPLIMLSIAIASRDVRYEIDTIGSTS